MADAVVRHVVTFGRVLREVGLEVGPGRVADALRGLDSVDLTRQEDVYFALRQTLVSRHDELELFDRAFNAWFLRAPVLPPLRQVQSPVAQEQQGDTLSEAGGGEPDEELGDPLELGASGHELLREKDFAEMTPDEYRRVKRLIAAIAGNRPLRASRRRRTGPTARARSSRASSSSSATCRARWTPTPARSSSFSTPPSARGRVSRRSPSGRGSRG
jgi:uncharacterized protein with von Willebrand factor type A (vWA) domain